MTTTCPRRILALIGALAVATPAAAQTLPAGAADALARVQASPRHGEWVMIPSGQDSIRAWIVYPERSEPAPVVLVVHEIFGLSHWIRAVADQLAADGFVAIAPDLLTMKNLPTDAQGATSADEARAVIGTLERADVHRHLKAVADWGMALPATTDRYGIVGFCWGGSTVFAHAVAAPQALGAVVVYYGGSPAPERLGTVRAPILGLYGADDARVNETVPPAEAALTAAGRTFESHFFEGAGHGFTRSQEGREGANLKAVEQAWPLTVAWFRRHLAN
jgi:carboxymethylenebutenolidase